MSKKSQSDNLVIKICPSCGKPFTTTKSSKKKYCSKQCNIERNEKYMLYNCDHCGVSMRITRKKYQEKVDGIRKHIYCSKECANESKHTGHDVVCDNCGKVFYRRQYHIDRQQLSGEHQFCSMKCQQEFRHAQAYEMRICSVCGNEFEVYKKSEQKFCSTKCQNVWQTTVVGETHPQFASIKIPCDYCGKEHYVKPYKFDEQDHFFCSVECRQKWYAEVYSQTSQYRDFHRNKVLQQLGSGNLQNINSKPQEIINCILDKLHIEYIREYALEYYAVDNYLTASNLIIEVQGDYWHANPIIYKTKLYDMQYDRICKDKRKHAYIKSQYNIEVLYLWEHDIYYNQKMCEQLILKYVQCNGILDNYHSFNYALDGGIILNTNIIVPYQEYSSIDCKQLVI